MALTARIAEIHMQSRRTYGAPRIHAELRVNGMRCGRKQLARLMRGARLVGCHRRRTVVGNAPDHLQRQFVAAAPNQRWTAAITSIST